MLIIVKEVIYEPNGLTFANVVIDRESADYGACTFEISDKKLFSELQRSLQQNRAVCDALETGQWIANNAV